MEKLTVEQVEQLIRETEERNLNLVSQTEEEDGGTLVYHTNTHKVIIDYNLTGLYNFSGSTIEEDDDEEENYREMKNVQSVLDYLEEFNK